MKLGHGNEIKFLSILGTITFFMLVIDGEDTMRIACDSADPDKIIHISTANGAVSLPTKGRFELTAKMVTDADGAPLAMDQRVDSMGVYRYILPRVPRLLARLLRAA
jgi:hypothetical protein